jgi:hypothetical protein
MLCVVSEDTERIVGERRMATLRDLGSEPTTGRDEYEYVLACSRHLESNPRSLPFTLTYLFEADSMAAQLAAATGIRAGHPAAPATIAATAKRPCWPVAEVAAGRTVVIDDLEQRFPALPNGAWREPPRTAVILPLPRRFPRLVPMAFSSSASTSTARSTTITSRSSV